MNLKVNGHYLIFVREVETRVSDRDVPEAIIHLPIYMCLTCGYEGFTPELFPCDDGYIIK
jgi:hypothetical protein